MKNKILLFIPVYNCKTQVLRLLKKLENEDLSLIHEVLFIDNKSNDGTFEFLNEKLKNSRIDTKLKLFQNENNYNLGGSHKVALNYSIQNHFHGMIIMHGDDQTDLKYVTDLLVKQKNKNFLGARFHEMSILPGYSIFRIFGNRLFNLFFSLVLQKKVYDIGCGLNYFYLEDFKDRNYLNYPDEILYPVYLNLDILINKKDYSWFSLKWEEKDQKSNARLFSDTVKLCMLLFNVILKKKFINKNKKNYKYTLIYEKKD